MSRLLSLSVALIALFMAPLANADPPSRVGRVSHVDGAMTVIGIDGNSPEAAPVNYPVSTGMRFTTAAGSRGELELGNITARLDGRTTLEVASLDDTTVALRLNAGSVEMRVRILFDGDNITIDTRDGQIALTAPGAYRVDAVGFGSLAPAPVTHLAVFAGSARIHSPHGDDDVFAGEGVDINGSAATMRYGQADTTWLDDWAAAREQETASADNTDQYVDPETAGADDLGRAGTWDDTPDYGPVWYPGDVSGDWAPYRFGSWTWVAPWGWTWIDDRPWGFAPFHYGRWVQIHGRWGWWPGERHRHPAYAPAVVGFDRDSLPSRHTRPHGWAPLAPGEPYHPPYPHNDTYVRNINAGTLHVGPPEHTGDRGPQPIQSWGNRVPGDQIIINDGTFRRPPRPDGVSAPVTNPTPGITAMPLVTPPPAPSTTPPASSYGQPAWRNDPRLNRGVQPPPMPVSPSVISTPSATPPVQSPLVRSPQMPAPLAQPPRPEPSFQVNPNQGFAPREMLRTPEPGPTPLRPGQNGPGPSTGGPWQPHTGTTGAGNVGQGNTGQGNTGQSGR